MAEKVVGVLAANGAERALVFFGHDGLDELTTTTTSTVHELRDGSVSTYTVDPRALGITPAEAADLRGGDAAANAAFAREVLAGHLGPHRDIVLLAAAAGIVAAGLVDDLAEGMAAAASAVDDGRAAAVLDGLVAASQAQAAGG
jgi:anthranilate phosphoribosyltransferase